MTDILIPLPGSTLNPRRISLDPRLNGGENLSKIYERIKRLERSLEMQTNRAQMIRSQLMEFNAALESLRNPSVTLSSRDISELLEKIKLAPSIQQKKIKPPKRTSAGLGRQFFVTDSICLTVGRNAIESDRIVKTAKSHEWWVHIAGGGHGAHVIISGLPPRINLPDNVLKSAAILALHFSDRTNALEGEVYCTRRQFIRKTKGLAAGLWIVDKSETYRVRYTSEDISQIFCKEFRQGAIRHGV